VGANRLWRLNTEARGRPRTHNRRLPLSHVVGSYGKMEMVTETSWNNKYILHVLFMFCFVLYVADTKHGYDQQSARYTGLLWE